MRKDYSVASSEIYHISPVQLRSLGIELIIRTSSNAYTSHKEHKDLTMEQRGSVYDELKRKIHSEGFKDEFPIIIMLLRKDGSKDKILEGHHRLNIAIELGLETVPVRFVY